MNRLQELAGITELTVNNPHKKREIFNYFLQNYPFTLHDIVHHKDLEQLDQDMDLELEGEELEMVKSYYNTFKYREIEALVMQCSEDDGSHNRPLPSTYKFITHKFDQDMVFTFLHNEKF